MQEKRQSTIDKLFCQCLNHDMTVICTIDEPAAAAAIMNPLRNQLLAELAQPESAASLAARMGIPRQRLNYHLRELEKLGLLEEAEQRNWGGLTERRLQATAPCYVVSNKPLGPLAATPERVTDRLSASYLIALAARLVTEVSDLIKRAKSAAKRLPTLSIDTVISFRSPTERAEFTAELTRTVNQLVSRYHDPTAQGSRAHRLVVAAHPLPQNPPVENNNASGEK